MKKTRISSVAVAALTAIVALTAVTPAQAADFAVTADKSKNLVAAGDTVTVTLANLPTGQGVYLRLCAGTLAEVAKARPADCVGMDKTVWASSLAAALRQGATEAAEPKAVSVVAQFSSAGKTIDCAVVACGIHVRRDHFGGTDFSLDRFIPVTFAAAAPAAPIAPTAVASVAAGKVKIQVANAKGQKVTFVVGSKKYVRTLNSDAYTFTAAAAKGAKTVKVSAVLGSRSIGSAQLNLK
jgi:hypothetical protein